MSTSLRVRSHCLALCFVFGASLLTLPAVDAASQPQLNPIFFAVLPRLKAETSVPVRLPATVYTNGVRLFADLTRHDARGYIVTLSTQENCSVRACVYGIIVVGPRRQNDPAAFSAARRVPLAHNLVGYIFEHCGANCDPPYIAWGDRSSEYAIYMKGKLSDRQFVEMANSMTVY